MKDTWTLPLLAVQAMAVAATLTLALDMYAHKRVEALGGVNVWGYRGAVVSHRRPNEIRVAVVGGTRAFGWGGSASALTSEIRRQIMLTTDRRGGELRTVVAANLGRLGALSDSYPATIARFSYLQPDYICLYDDLGVRGASPDSRSGVFELTGYAPALPLVLREKGMVWRLGDVRRGYAPAESQRETTTSPWRRTAGSMLEWVAGGLGAADRAVASALPQGNRDASARGGQTMSYADAMMTAVDAAHRHARGVVVAVSPSETAEQVRNLRDLKIRMENEWGSAPWIRFVDLGAEPALTDPALRLDGWNYASAGVAVVADTIAPALLSLIATSHL